MILAIFSPDTIFAALSCSIQIIFSSISYSCMRDNIIAAEIFAPVYDLSNCQALSITSFFSIVCEMTKWAVKLKKE